MNEKEEKRISKHLSLILRHKPESINISLDSNGWADVNELIDKLNLNLNDLKQIVANNDKKRFILSDDFSKIRANQGHSISVDLNLEEEAPPLVLYHGTAVKNLDSIKSKGLIKGQRQYVHLSLDQDTALKVGQRYGKPTILEIKAYNMYTQGFKFYLSENKVWLTDHIPPEFITFK